MSDQNDNDNNKEELNKGAVTQDQFDTLQEQLTKAMEVVDAQKTSIDKLEGNNAALLAEKKKEEDKLIAARLEQQLKDGDHKTILDDERVKWNTEREGMKSKMDTLSKQFHGITGDGVLIATLEAARINPAQMNVVAAKFRSE